MKNQALKKPVYITFLTEKEIEEIDNLDRFGRNDIIVFLTRLSFFELALLRIGSRRKGFIYSYLNNNLIVKGFYFRHTDNLEIDKDAIENLIVREYRKNHQRTLRSTIGGERRA